MYLLAPSAAEGIREADKEKGKDYTPAGTDNNLGRARIYRVHGAAACGHYYTNDYSRTTYTTHCCAITTMANPRKIIYKCAQTLNRLGRGEKQISQADLVR